MAVKDTAAIKKGIGLLLSYYAKFSEQINEDEELDLDITDIYEKLSTTKDTIIDIFEDEVANIIKGRDEEDETLGYRKAE